MATEVLDREKLISAIWSSKGRPSLIAEAMGVTVRTIYNYIDRYATVKNAYEDAKQQFYENLVDTAEMKTHKAVDDGERWAIKHVLDNSPEAKRRGWGPRHELTGADGEALKVEHWLSELRKAEQ